MITLYINFGIWVLITIAIIGIAITIYYYTIHHAKHHHHQPFIEIGSEREEFFVPGDDPIPNKNRES